MAVLPIHKLDFTGEGYSASGIRASPASPGEEEQQSAPETQLAAAPAAIPPPPRAPDEPKEEPSGAKTFEATMNRGADEAPYGLHLDLSDGMALYICRLGTPETASGKYNAAAPEGSKLMQGDYILAVNGISGDAKRMAEEVRVRGSLRLQICRPEYTKVTLEKTKGASLGLDLRYSAASNSLCVCTVVPGSLVDTLGLDIRMTDRIVAVGGKEGTASMLLSWLKESTTLELTMSRCSLLRQAAIPRA